MIVAGDPDHCAALGRALTRAGGGVDTAVRDLGRAAGATNTWHGTAADAFRASAEAQSAAGRDLSAALQAAGRALSAFAEDLAADAFRASAEAQSVAGHDLSAALQAAGRALSAFAEDLAAAQQQAAHARFVAGTAGLSLSASGTVPSVPAPVGPFSSPEQQAAAEARTRSLSEARLDVLRLVAWARDAERTAHERLLRALSGLDDLRPSKDGGYQGPAWLELVDVTTGLVKSPHQMRDLAAARSATLRAEARRLLLQANASTGTEKLHWLTRRGEVLAELRESRRDVVRGSELVGRAGPVGSVVSRADAFRFGVPVLKHVPVLGTAMTGVGIVTDVRYKDMDPGHATAKNVAGTLAGMGTTVLVTAALGGASIAALPVLAAVGAGVFASWGTGVLVENYGDDLADAAKGLWDRIS